MRLTVLGSAGSHPGPDRACSSYLVEDEGYRLLLDCGNGSMSNLQKVSQPWELDAILLSHRHPDHWADLIGIYLALRFHPDGPREVPLFGPEGIDEFVRQLIPGDDDFAQRCPFTALTPGDRRAFGPLDVEVFEAEHPPPTLCSRITGTSGAVLCYSADSAPTPNLTRAARRADLLVADCTWTEDVPGRPEGIHMTGAEAGALAEEAEAARLMVTHVWPQLDPEVVAAEARERYRGDVLIARDLQVVEL